MVGQQADDAVLLQLGEGAADRFRRQAQVIADVRTAHRHRHRVVRLSALLGALAQHEQEGGDLLPRGLAAQQQHLILRRRQLVAGDAQQALLDLGQALHQVFQLLARETAQQAGRHRLGAEGVGVLGGQAEEIPRKEEAGHLAPPVGQQLVDLQGAGGEIIDVARLFALVEQRPARVQLDGGHERRDLSQFLRIERRTDRHAAHRTGGTRRVLGTVACHGRRQLAHPVKIENRHVPPNSEQHHSAGGPPAFFKHPAGAGPAGPNLLIWINDADRH